MPVRIDQLTAEGTSFLIRLYEDANRIEVADGFILARDEAGTVVGAHAACPGLSARYGEPPAAAPEPLPGVDWSAYAPPEEDPAGKDVEPALVAHLRRLGDLHGPLGVALAAADLTDPAAVAAALSADRSEPSGPEGSPEPLPLDRDPRRPRPDWYPDDAVTLTYRELRNLLAWHLGIAAEAVGGAEPHTGRLAVLVGAMRDGEAPLHLANILDQ